jgi:hypothetical protein
MAATAEKRQESRIHEEDSGQHHGDFLQNIRGLGAKKRFSHTGPKGQSGGRAVASALLEQNDRNQQNAADSFDNTEYRNDDMK